MEFSKSTLFELEPSVRNPILRTLRPVVRNFLKKGLCIETLQEIYDRIQERRDGAHFVDKVLECMDISYHVSKGDLSVIPAEGPVIVVSNHAFGAIDGIVLHSILLSVRKDVRIMANYLLGIISELRESLLLVDPFGTSKAVTSNIATLKATLGWLKGGGALGIFPAGEVAHFDMHKFRVTDPQWGHTLARLVRKTHSPVVPVFFEGSNSALFHVLGLLHPRLRTLMLPREMLKKRHTNIKVRIGRLIPHQKLEKLESDRALVEYLRFRTYVLATGKNDGVTTNAYREDQPALQPIVSARALDLPKAEVRKLPENQVLVETDRFSVFEAKAEQIPSVMHEIGRLREWTFRKAGEGTGKAIDLDRYDEYYRHIFLWDNEQDQLVGSYRMGLTDEILATHGLEGLYTHSLFEFQPKFVEKISCGGELGRSFVRPEYQRSYHPLMLLWKGIALFVSRHPRYSTLFGVVSIPNDYTTISRQLMVAFLKANHHGSDLARYVKARNPLKPRLGRENEIRKALHLFRDIQDLSELVSDIEDDQKGVPILFKQYLKLGGRFVGYNLDPEFSNVLDALILVDVTRTERRVLERYMGKDGVAAFLNYHSPGSMENCA